MRQALLGGLRLTGLRLVVVALSAVGLITTSAALELFRFGELSATIEHSIDAAAAGQQALFALSQALGAVALDDSDETRASLARAAEAAQAAAGDLPVGAPLAEQSDAASALAAKGAQQLGSGIALWGKASAWLSQVLSLLLASIVVLLFTVVLRMLAYLSARDRTEAELRRAKAGAEAANAAKSDFLASISHEIRTPLTAIRGYSDLLAAGPLDDAQRDQLDRLRDANCVLGRLIEDMLDLSKIEAGRIDLLDAPFDVAAMIDRVLGMVRPVAGAKGLALIAHVAPDVPRVLVADEARLMQIVLNLTNNAVKFTPSGRVVVDVARQGDWLQIAVSDTGIGIAASDMPNLFKRFSQIDSSLMRAHAGSGLGLAISAGLAERMGGRITVESAPGAGSTFRVTLPLAKAAAAAAPTPRRAEPPLRQGARVLVVEDSRQNQHLIEAVLRRDGIVCTAAFDGIEGVAAAQAGGFDLVIMDMQMPRMDGIAATAAIRALPAPMGRVPILALSANALDRQVAAMRAAGADTHLAKPFAIDALSRSVAALIGAALIGAGPARAVQPGSADVAGLDALAGLLGCDWAAERLSAMAGGLGWIDADPASPDMRRNAHRLVSEAGQLGLAALAEAAAGLEQALDAGGDLAGAHHALACEARAVRAALPMLTAHLRHI